LGKPGDLPEQEQLGTQIWTQSADHHPGQRLLERRIQRPDRRTRSITCSKGQKLLASRTATTEEDRTLSTVKHTPQMMGTTARFHCNHASVEVQHKRNQTDAPQTLSHDNLTGCV